MVEISARVDARNPNSRRVAKQAQAAWSNFQGRETDGDPVWRQASAKPEMRVPWSTPGPPAFDMDCVLSRKAQIASQSRHAHYTCLSIALQDNGKRPKALFLLPFRQWALPQKPRRDAAASGVPSTRRDGLVQHRLAHLRRTLKQPADHRHLESVEHGAEAQETAPGERILFRARNTMSMASAIDAHLDSASTPAAPTAIPPEAIGG